MTHSEVDISACLSTPADVIRFHEPQFEIALLSASDPTVQYYSPKLCQPITAPTSLLEFEKVSSMSSDTVCQVVKVEKSRKIRIRTPQFESASTDFPKSAKGEQLKYSENFDGGLGFAKKFVVKGVVQSGVELSQTADRLSSHKSERALLCDEAPGAELCSNEATPTNSSLKTSRSSSARSTNSSSSRRNGLKSPSSGDAQLRSRRESSNGIENHVHLLNEADSIIMHNLKLEVREDPEYFQIH